jgi:AmmeMemoRadiSam system protein B/AmmeMemoRadiSam system protein A
MDTIRQPAFAGVFYESDPELLRQQIKALFEDAQNSVISSSRKTRALILPHAGYNYSGRVAASGINQINSDTDYATIFLIGSSHRANFDGASVYKGHAFQTPFGNVPVDMETAERLTLASPYFSFSQQPHNKEHGLEVHLPLLQFHLRKEFKIVPILIGTQNPVTSYNIAEILQAWFTDENLFIVSTDFSHYPDYNSARILDNATIQSILKNSPSKLLETLHSNENQGIPNLATSLCGWSAILTLLHITEHDGDLQFHQILYENSGDSPLGDKERVVGYNSLVISSPKTKGFDLSEAEKKLLIDRAKESIGSIFTKKIISANVATLPLALKTHTGAFVSIYRDNHLAGCIGHIGEDEPLWQVIDRVAKSAAVEDTRFKPLAHEDYHDIQIEISVLTPARKIDDISEIIPGKHGILLRKDKHQGTFLPQVASRMNWSALEMLEHCARDKVKIGADGWKDADLYIYEALVFGDIHRPSSLPKYSFVSMATKHASHEWETE